MLLRVKNEITLLLQVKKIQLQKNGLFPEFFSKKNQNFENAFQFNIFSKTFPKNKNFRFPKLQ